MTPITECVGWTPHKPSTSASIKTGTPDDEDAEPALDEEKARALKWHIDSVTGGVRRCIGPKKDAKQAMADASIAVIADALLDRR